MSTPPPPQTAPPLTFVTGSVSAPQTPYRAKGAKESGRRAAQATFTALTIFAVSNHDSVISPASILDFLEQKRASGSTPCHSIHCEDHDNCPYPADCPTQLSYAYLLTLRKHLRSTLPLAGQAMLEEKVIADFFNDTKAFQASRPPRWPTTMTFEALTEICATVDIIILNALQVEDNQTALTFTQLKVAICIEWHGNGPRCNEMLRVLVAQRAVSKYKDGQAFSHFNLLNTKIESSPNHVAVPHIDNCLNIYLAQLQLKTLCEDVGLPSGVPNRESRVSPYVFTLFKTSKLNRDVVLPLTNNRGHFRPQTAVNLNKALTTAIEQAGLADTYRGFCLTDFRSSALLHDMDSESNISRLNASVGWAKQSNMAYHYGRQQQYSSHLKHAVASASIVNKANAAQFSSIF